jgi:SAM-dependent methyltransferase
LRVDIERGKLFESSALDYDQFRPSYPAKIINELVTLSCLKSSSRLLEVGCGTGKATVSMAARGYLIDCIDPGKSLIAFAKRNCKSWPNVTFRVSKFEDIQLEASHYDLVYAAQSFHWVDPKVRLRKAADVLKRDGCIALMYNYPGKQKDPLVEAISAAVLKESDGKMKPWDYVDEISNWKDEIERFDAFRDLSIVRHRWSARYSSSTYPGLYRTYSDFLSLPAKAKRRVTDRMREIIQENGGYVTRTYDSVLLHAVRN